MPSPKIRKKPTNKRCEKGFPCKTTCISRAKNCRKPLKWQAETFALWLKAQEERLAITNQKRERAGLVPAQLTEHGYITAERTKLAIPTKATKTGSETAIAPATPKDSSTVSAKSARSRIGKAKTEAEVKALISQAKREAEQEVTNYKKAIADLYREAIKGVSGLETSEAKQEYYLRKTKEAQAIEKEAMSRFFNAAPYRSKVGGYGEIPEGMEDLVMLNQAQGARVWHNGKMRAFNNAQRKFSDDLHNALFNPTLKESKAVTKTTNSDRPSHITDGSTPTIRQKKGKTKTAIADRATQNAINRILNSDSTDEVKILKLTNLGMKSLGSSMNQKAIQSAISSLGKTEKAIKHSAEEDNAVNVKAFIEATTPSDVGIGFNKLNDDIRSKEIYQSEQYLLSKVGKTKAITQGNRSEDDSNLIRLSDGSFLDISLLNESERRQAKRHQDNTIKANVAHKERSEFFDQDMLRVYKDVTDPKLIRQLKNQAIKLILKDTVIGNLLPEKAPLQNRSEEVIAAPSSPTVEPKKAISVPTPESKTEKAIADVVSQKDEIIARLKRKYPKTSADDIKYMAKNQLMQQAVDSHKRDNPDAILLVKTGDFFQAFKDDAVKLGNTIEFAVSTIQWGDEQKNRVPTTGFPYHSRERYFAQLRDKGIRFSVLEPDGEGWFTKTPFVPKIHQSAIAANQGKGYEYLGKTETEHPAGDDGDKIVMEYRLRPTTSDDFYRDSPILMGDKFILEKRRSEIFGGQKQDGDWAIAGRGKTKKDALMGVASSSDFRKMKSEHPDVKMAIDEYDQGRSKANESAKSKQRASEVESARKTLRGHQNHLSLLREKDPQFKTDYGKKERKRMGDSIDELFGAYPELASEFAGIKESLKPQRGKVATPSFEQTVVTEVAGSKNNQAIASNSSQLSDNDIRLAIKKTLDQDPAKANDSLFPIYVADNLLGRTKENSVYMGSFANDIRYLGKDITREKLAQAMTSGAESSYRASSGISDLDYARLMDDIAKGNLNEGNINGSIPNKRTTTSLLVGENAIREKATSVIKKQLKEEGVNPNSKKYKEAIAKNIDSVAEQIAASLVADAKAYLNDLMLLQKQRQSGMDILTKRVNSISRDLNDLKRIGAEQSVIDLVQSALNKVNYEMTQSRLAYQQDIDRVKQFLDNQNKAIAD